LNLEIRSRWRTSGSLIVKARAAELAGSRAAYCIANPKTA
jgi:hypothetical protein